MKQTTTTVWEAFNEPVIEITDEQAKNLVLASVVIIAAAWIAPYWGATQTAAYTGVYSSGTVFEQMASAEIGGTVAGASTENISGEAVDEATAPEWYYVIEGLPAATVASFSVGASEVLDISQPVKNLADFYQPGVDAVWNEWLNMIREPGTPSF